jgi:hypothetical protein
VRYRLDNHPDVPKDFERILSFIGEYAGYPLARRKIIEIKHAIANLKALPHVGTIASVNDETRTVKIICVTYAGQDWQTIAREREA